VDVPACPGSGKTTLVVAKLALLARNWPWRTRGICVLSHTNVAREEIEKRLGPTPVGHRLAGYPHFIDTIHGFLGRFLAIPFLRSHGKAFQAFNDDLTNRARRRGVSPEDFHSLAWFLDHKKPKWAIDSLRIGNPAYDLKAFPAGRESPTFGTAQRAVRHAAECGFFCYDDVFMLAEALLLEEPLIADILRQRFPFVLLDEMQDTDSRQGHILASIFPRDREDICVQRVGDPNQAIFDDVHDADEVGFPDPDPGNRLTIPNSFRFGQKIASCVSPIAVSSPGLGGLLGVGPHHERDLAPPPMVLVFPDDSIQGVLPAFANIVLEHLPDSLLAKGKVAAVAAVQKAIPEPEQRKFPQTLAEYWNGYEPSIRAKAHHPGTLVEYILIGQRKALENSTFGEAVNDIGFAVLHLLRLQVGDAPASVRNRYHRVVIEKLGNVAASSYRTLVLELLENQTPVNPLKWTSLKARFLTLLGVLGGGQAPSTAALSFLSWPQRLHPGLTQQERGKSLGQANTYHHESGGRAVDICLGSIHSVKGETLLATLLLDVFNQHYFSKSLIGPLRNLPPTKKDKKPGVFDLKHRRLAYVAMTRPTHLLCLAIRASTLGLGADENRCIQELEAQGWQVRRIG